MKQKKKLIYDKSIEETVPNTVEKFILFCMRILLQQYTCMEKDWLDKEKSDISKYSIFSLFFDDFRNEEYIQSLSSRK